MGYMVHHSIIVSSSDDKQLLDAHAKATEIFGVLVSGVIESHVNGYKSFFVAPDGSKEGWTISDTGNDKRDKFVAWLDAQRYEDDSTSLAWVEIQFNDDEHETGIVRDSDERLRISLSSK